MKTVFVEDRADIRQEMQAMIQAECPELQLAGTADSVVQGLKVIRAENPELLLLDIELPDGTAFDLLDVLDKPVKVIFITGSDAYAIRAFRYSALDYLLKPVDPAELREAVKRVQKMEGSGQERYPIYRNAMQQRDTVPQRIAVHTSDKIQFLDIADIVRCSADGNYTRFTLRNGSSLLVARTLKDYDNLLSSADFLRVHQSHLVNMKHVKEYVKADGGYLVMLDGTKVPVSTRKKAEVLEYFDRIAHA